MKILIVGGGIAGTTLALTLRRAGLDPVVAEARAQRTDTGGAFLGLAPNGINALRSVGLGDVPEAAGGFPLAGMDFHNAHGRRIAELPGEDDATTYGSPTVLLRRAELQAELAARAQAAELPWELDARLVQLAEEPDGVRATFADGRTMVADLVIGADGIWSTVRRLTWPNAPKPAYTGIVDCGGWATVSLPDTARQQMYFGRRAFFSYTVKDGVAFWFTNMPRADEPARSELDHLDPTGWMAQIRRLHSRDTPEVRAVLDAADSSVGAWPVYDLPPLPAWHTDRICLVGDAAHAVSPSSGQGASLAIEDAVALARQLRDAPRVDAALAGFVAERKERAERIVRFGRQIGNRKASSGVGSLFRDLTLRFFLRMGARAAAEHHGYRAAA